VLILAGPVGEAAHDGGGHPERPERVLAALAGVEDLHLGSDLVRVEPAAAGREALERVHSADYLDELEAFARRGGGALDPDTYVVGDSFHTALLAAGAGPAVVAELQRRASGVGFVCARPPGHHATRQRGMGFCLLNNIAVTAAALADAGARVAVVDWDVHHGNGTQDVFWDDPRVLYASTHQWPLYPGTGRADEVGGAGAAGTTLNVPLPAGATGDVVRRAFDDLVVPAVERFGPDWVLVSAGFDAHRADPLAELSLSAADFGILAATVGALAPAPGRTVLFLEGGYDLAALRRSTAAALSSLLGGPPGAEEPTFGGPGEAAVLAAARARRLALEAAGETGMAGALDARITGPAGADRGLREGW
jgi:acetoin utilization deacetylase AcuC-like enzyme